MKEKPNENKSDYLRRLKISNAKNNCLIYLMNNQKDLKPEYHKLVNENFWDLI
jgi:hypothetical protein